MDKNLSDIIFGKNETKNIVSIEPHDGYLECFIEKDGVVSTKFIRNHEDRLDANYWILSDKSHDKFWYKLKGDLHYKYYTKMIERKDYLRARWQLKKESADFYSVYNEKEHVMISKGFTYYKGMKVDDVSVLSFDIETTGLDPLAHDSRVVMIANTFRKNGKITRKLFSYDNYTRDADMFESWVRWVREMDPSIIVNHNIFGFDLPYMTKVAAKNGVFLRIGRDKSPIRFEEWDSRFRFDGSTEYTYKRCHIYGREIVDTFFLAMKYDAGRKYTNYRLKGIIEQEGLEAENRQHYDASQIRYNYKDPVELAKIKDYARFDGDDALKLFDLFIPAFFYMSQSIPKPFQMVCYTASGSQINSMMVRSYLQQGHSIPKASETHEFQGAISFGLKGAYKDVHKVDVVSLYPSIMIEYNIFNEVKDPKAVFQSMVNYFTNERLSNKKNYKDTNDRYYNDLQSAQKIIINSFYGFMGTTGLNFNSVEHAALVTKYGRKIITESIRWAKKKGFQIVNCDTDSISYTDNRFIPKEERNELVIDINSNYPSHIRFEDDGYYNEVLVLKAKNYYLVSEDGKKTIKGSALKATTKSPKLKQFIKDIIALLLEKDIEGVVNSYTNICREIFNIPDIEQWATKKTITEKVLYPKRAQEQKVFDAIRGKESISKGDKVYIYYDYNENVKLVEDWSHDHNTDRLLKSIYNTLKVFKDLIPGFKEIPNYVLKKNKELLNTNVLNKTKI